MSSKIKIISTVTLLCILFIVGCYGKRIVWSPDGTWGAVTNNAGLYFTDPEGNITKNMHEHVYRAHWFPDGRHLAVEECANIANWNQLEKTVSKEDQRKYVKYAKHLLESASQAEWDTMAEALIDLGHISEDELTAVKMYIRDRQRQSFPESVINSWDNNMFFPYHFLRVGMWDGKKFTIEKTLWSSSERIWDMRTSQKGRAIVFTSAYPQQDDDDEPKVSSLWIADRVTGKAILLDQNVALYPDWSADGLILYYVRSIGESRAGSSVGTLLQNEMCDAEGALVSNVSAPKSLAGLVVGEFMKVRCLTDGRIIFSSMELTLPVIGKDVPDYKQLFVLDPARQATIARLIPNRTLDQIRGFNPDYFEVSPDEKMISLVDDDGRVAVLEMANGDVTILQSEKLGPEVVVPVWRYPNELCYVGKGESKNGLFEKKEYKQVFLQSRDDENGWLQERAISKSWPDQVKKDWLEYEK